MNARTIVPLMIAGAAVALTACSASPTATAETSAGAHHGAARADCNLSVEWDPGADRYEASYAPAPIFLSAEEVPRTRYVAGEACDLAEIVRWQEVRAAHSQPNDVCQIAWRYDELGQVDVVACVTVRRVS